MIRLLGVRKSLGGREVLAGIDLTAPAGQVTFVLGESGAGKTVLSRCAVGLLRIDAGEIYLGGERVDRLPERRLAQVRRRFVYVPQGAGLLDWLDLESNVALPLLRAGWNRAEALRAAAATLERVGLSLWLKRRPHEVGPGTAKRASIARALALSPLAIIYDEPTAGLDPVSARQIDELIRESARSGVTALVVSHDLVSVCAIADRVALLAEGRLTTFESGEALARSPLPAARRFLGLVAQ